MCQTVSLLLANQWSIYSLWDSSVLVLRWGHTGASVACIPSRWADHAISQSFLLFLPLWDPLESLASRDISLGLFRVELIHVFLVVEPFFLGKISLQSDCAQGTTWRVSPIKQRFSLRDQGRVETIWFPDSFSIPNVRGWCCNFCRHASFTVFLRFDQSSVIFGHVLLQFFVISVKLLPNWFRDIACVLSPDKIELHRLFSGTSRCN